MQGVCMGGSSGTDLKLSTCLGKGGSSAGHFCSSITRHCWKRQEGTEITKLGRKNMYRSRCVFRHLTGRVPSVPCASVVQWWVRWGAAACCSYILERSKPRIFNCVSSYISIVFICDVKNREHFWLWLLFCIDSHFIPCMYLHIMSIHWHNQTHATKNKTFYGDESLHDAYWHCSF